MKVCIKCNIEQPLDRFRKHKECIGGRSGTCKNCFKSQTKTYEKSKTGFLMRLYRNMKSRVTGVQKEKFHLYEGKELLNKETFYKGAETNSEFHRLFKEYEDSGYERKLAPSVDRIDSEKGYNLENMEFVTMSVNSQRGSFSQARQNKNKKSKAFTYNENR